MGSAELPTVLVVEDEAPLVEIYARWLADGYDVRTAENGREALEQLDSTVDVVLLDRLMPGMSGDEILTTVHRETPECKVAMVTAVEPDFDILTMGFDDYLTKPVTRDELVSTVDRLVARTSFVALEQEFYALVAKRAALQTTKIREQLAESEEFQDLNDRIKALRAELEVTMPSIQDDEFVAMVRDLERRRGYAGGCP
jgi:two-component system response regulator AdeR